MTTTTRFLLLTISVAFWCNNLTAQDRENYGLLWEIQHKNSTKKSYLFGTLHLKDSRAFQFSDSVIPAIKKSEMFALEVNPDSIYNDFDQLYSPKNSENVLKKILSKVDYQRLKDRFYKVNKIDLDSIPGIHPQLVKSRLTDVKSKADDRNVFLDAYLYGIAYNHNKEVTGLEKFEDQLPAIEDIDNEELIDDILSILNSTPKEIDTQLEEIIQLYFDGDIDEILRYINLYDAEDKSMISRNNVMVNSLDKIMQDKTIFAAVGAAHLPGENGMLQLLKNMGYTVRKLGATFNDTDERHNIVPNTDRWYINNDKSLGFSVLTPNKPISLKIDERYETLSSTDLIFGGTFAFMAMDLRNQQLKENFDFVENIIMGQRKDSTFSILNRKSFLKNSVEFTEVTIENQKIVSRMQLAMSNKIVYFFFTEGSLAEINSPYANAFFNSIEVFTPRFEPSVWQTKIDSLGAYSIRIPGSEKDRTQEMPNATGEVESPYVLNIFSSEDKAENTIYVFRYNDQPLGYYINNKGDYYAEFDEFFKERGTLLSEPKIINMDGAEGKEYELLFSNKYHTKAKSFLRGNRTYLLMAQKSVENDRISEDDNFFNSFKFIPYAESSFDTVVNINDRYSFKTPSKKIVHNEEDYDPSMEYSSIKTYTSVDLNTAGTYLVQKAMLKPYFRKKSLQAFYDAYVEQITEQSDTVISNISTTLGGKPAREIRMHNSDTDVKQRMKLLLDGDTVLLFLAYVGDEEINKPRIDQFFDSFEIKKKATKFDLTASKADLIFKNLKSKDSIKYKEAKEAMAFYEFDVSEYNILKKNLTESYADDDEYYGIKYYIISALSELENTETLKAFTDFYKNKNNSYYARLEVLEQILNLKNIDALATYFDLLENHKPDRIPDKSYDFLRSISDTIPLFISNDMRFSKLAEIDDYREQIASIYAYQVSGDSVVGNKMPMLKNKLLSHMYRDSQMYVDTLMRKENNYLTYDLIVNYIEVAKDSDGENVEIIKTLEFLSENVTDNEWLQTLALMASAELDIDIDRITWDNALKSLYSRFELMESLVNSNQIDIIPEEYLKFEEFAKLSLYNTVGNQNSYYPDVLNFLGETSVVGKQYYAFSFSNSNDDEEEETYLGLVEQSEINYSDFKMANVLFNWDLLEEDWEAQATSLLKNALNDEDSDLE